MTSSHLKILGTPPNAWRVDENTADITRAPLLPRLLSVATATKTL